MKGILLYNNERWFMQYEENNNTFVLDVKKGRIDDLKKIGVILNEGDEVEFEMEEFSSFPYRWAVPKVHKFTDENTTPYPQSTASIYTPPKPTKKQYKITLWLSGFYENEVEVTCDNYDCSSNGYFYFYDEVDGRRKILCTYPVERTALHEIEIIETEY